jgi:acetyl esterase/lipase
MTRVYPTLAVLGFVCSTASALYAQTTEAAAKLVEIAESYEVLSNVRYQRANNWDATLDIYRPRGLKQPNPTLMYFHGGGWTSGSKERASLTFLPYFELGWTVVNVEYRIASVSPAPAAIEDCRCALRWIHQNAREYNIDVTRIVVSGNSAGGLLALTTGMLPPASGLDRGCAEDLGPQPIPAGGPKVAAIINWYGITDVGELLDGPRARSFAIAWLGSTLNREEIARRASPLTYVRPGLPPVLTIHGNADPDVPYSQAVRLHEALQAAGVPTELVTVPGGDHGDFPFTENLRIYAAIRSFLTTHHLLRSTGSH